MLLIWRARCLVGILFEKWDAKLIIGKLILFIILGLSYSNESNADRICKLFEENEWFDLKVATCRVVIDKLHLKCIIDGSIDARGKLVK